MANTATKAGPRLILNPKTPLFEQVRDVLRFHYYSPRTEKAYIQGQVPRYEVAGGLAGGNAQGEEFLLRLERRYKVALL